MVLCANMFKKLSTSCVNSDFELLHPPIHNVCDNFKIIDSFTILNRCFIY